jgi:DNA-directed RNA polymerase specialized sigma24 family protein
MSNGVHAGSIDDEFRLARSGDQDAFAKWMAMVELTLRCRLARFARAVDVEVIMQETFMRMWLVALDKTRAIEGENASLRFASAIAQNVAREEARRTRREQFVDPRDLDRLQKDWVDPETTDPALGKAIRACVESLPSKPKTALKARIRDGHLPDRDLAREVRMKLNTFLQNIVRARRLLGDCLERRGVRLGELLP